MFLELGSAGNVASLWQKYYVHMYVDEKMSPLTTPTGMGRGRTEEGDGGGECNNDML
jgi:hypothetical protein